jgi:hypothetical protein
MYEAQARHQPQNDWGKIEDRFAGFFHQGVHRTPIRLRKTAQIGRRTGPGKVSSRLVTERMAGTKGSCGALLPALSPRQ